MDEIKEVGWRNVTTAHLTSVMVTQPAVVFLRGSQMLRNTSLAEIFWRIFPTEVLTTLLEETKLQLQIDHQGDCAANRITMNHIKSFVRMCVNILSFGKDRENASTLVEFLRLKDRVGSKPPHRVDERRFNLLLSVLKDRIGAEILVDLFNHHSMEIWDTSTLPILCVDESMIPWLAREEFVMFIERKPNPIGAVMYMISVILPWSKLPVTYHMIPNFTVRGRRLSGKEIVDGAANWIKTCQREKQLATPLCLVGDSLFGSEDETERLLPDIRCCFSLSSFDMSELVMEGLHVGETWVIGRHIDGADLLYTVYKGEKKAYINLTSLYTFVEEALGDHTYPPLPVSLRSTIPESDVYHMRCMSLETLQRIAMLIGTPQTNTGLAITGKFFHISEERVLEAKLFDGTEEPPEPPAKRKKRDTEKEPVTVSSKSTEEDLKKLTCAQLIEALEKFPHAKTSGTKQRLIQRLLKWESRKGTDPDVELECFLYDKRTKELDSRGKPIKTPPIQIYKENFPAVDREDALTGLLPEMWQVRHFSHKLWFWMVSNKIIETLAAYTEAFHLFKHSPIKQFAKELCLSLQEEENN